MGSANSNVVMLVVLAPCAQPTFSPVAGTYTGTQTVTISSSTSGAAIYYTTDGSTPTFPVTGTTLLYSTPVSVASSETIKAVATKAGLANSTVGSAAYVINAPVPVTFTIASGDNSTGPFGTGTGEGWASADGPAFPMITNAVGGAISPPEPFFNGNEIGMWCFIGGANTMNFFLRGTFAQNYISKVQWTNRLAALETYLQAAATFNASTYPGYSLWTWPAVLNSPFNNGTNYAITVTP